MAQSVAHHASRHGRRRRRSRSPALDRHADHGSGTRREPGAGPVLARLLLRLRSVVGRQELHVRRDGRGCRRELPALPRANRRLAPHPALRRGVRHAVSRRPLGPVPCERARRASWFSCPRNRGSRSRSPSRDSPPSAWRSSPTANASWSAARSPGMVCASTWGTSPASRPRPITPEGIRPGRATKPISPDGQWVFANGPDGALYLYPVESGQSKLLPGALPGDRPFQWTSDSRAVYVMERKGIAFSIFRVDVATGRRDLWKEIRAAGSGRLLGHHELFHRLRRPVLRLLVPANAGRSLPGQRIEVSSFVVELAEVWRSAFDRWLRTCKAGIESDHTDPDSSRSRALRNPISRSGGLE